MIESRTRSRPCWRTGLILWLACAVIVLNGCAVSRFVSPNTYVVRHGDTLSLIAYRYGLDWHDLARWNHLSPPYTIYVGQRLAMNPAYAPRRGRTTPRGSGTSTAGAGRSTPSRTTTSRRSGSSVAKPATPAPKPGDWRWPLAASVLQAHAAKKTRHGIDLPGTAGVSVYAASDGQVVYSGDGLQDFGKLVIIKHGGEYLSAYSYVRNLQVKEGQRVSKGQHIADMGMGPGNRAALHFEIRYKGQPISPASVLPKR